MTETVAVYVPANKAFNSGIETDPVMCITTRSAMKESCNWTTCGEWCLSKVRLLAITSTAYDENINPFIAFHYRVQVLVFKYLSIFVRMEALCSFRIAQISSTKHVMG